MTEDRTALFDGCVGVGRFVRGPKAPRLTLGSRPVQRGFSRWDGLLLIVVAGPASGIGRKVRSIQGLPSIRSDRRSGARQVSLH
jgi:hypothetical protein